jgi:hypothetical protein
VSDRLVVSSESRVMAYGTTGQQENQTAERT